MHYYGSHLTNNQVHNTNPNQLRVLEAGNSPTILGNALSPFELVITQQDLQLNMLSDHPVLRRRRDYCPDKRPDDRRAYSIVDPVALSPARRVRVHFPGSLVSFMPRGREVDSDSYCEPDCWSNGFRSNACRSAVSAAGRIRADLIC